MAADRNKPGFLRLPPELRNDIYELALVPDVEEPVDIFSLPMLQAKHDSLMLVNHQLYDECRLLCGETFRKFLASKAFKARFAHGFDIDICRQPLPTLSTYNANTAAFTKRIARVDADHLQQIRSLIIEIETPEDEGWNWYWTRLKLVDFRGSWRFFDNTGSDEIVVLTGETWPRDMKYFEVRDSELAQEAVDKIRQSVSVKKQLMELVDYFF